MATTLSTGTFIRRSSAHAWYSAGGRPGAEVRKRVVSSPFAGSMYVKTAVLPGPVTGREPSGVPAPCAAPRLRVNLHDLVDRYRRPDRQLAGTAVHDPARVADLGRRPTFPGPRATLGPRGGGPHDPSQLELLHPDLAPRLRRAFRVEP